MSKLSTERAIDALDTVRAYYASLTAGYPKGKDCKAIGDVMCSEIANSCLMAIKALEQEPCEDCISREKAINQCGFGMTSLLIADCLRRLPSVTPQPKMGKWINKYAEDACGERYSYWACSECGRDVGFNLANIEDVLSEYPYCHCGAKMVEPQESEDKE